MSLEKLAKVDHATTPGYKTTEFWLSAIAMICGLVMASGAVTEDTLAAQIIGGSMAILAQLGYTASRAKVKESEAAPLPEIE